MIKTNGGFLISQIKQVGGRIFEKMLTRAGVDEFNGAQGRILFVLWQNDNLTISELSQKTGLAKTTLTSMLDRLEQSGILCRVFDKADRRQIRIVLTEKAKALSEQYDAVSDGMSELYYKGFTDTEIIAFEETLNRILRNLTESEN